MTSPLLIYDPAEFGRVAVLLGGTSSEREVSLDSGRNVLEALRRRGVDAAAVDGIPALVAALNAPGGRKFDRVFNILHGNRGGGEDGVLQGLLESLDVPYTGSGVLGSALAMDSVCRPSLQTLLTGFPADAAAAEALLALPRLYGGRGILDEAARLPFPPASRAALANLVDVITVLENYGLAGHVILDLAEAHAFEYCTGVVFGAFARGLGYQLSNGGRYDHLIGQFGYPCPATGFSFDLVRIMAALEAARALPAVTGPDVLLIDFSPDKRAAHRLARLLRERGVTVARDIIKRELAGSLAYARAAAIRSAVILGVADQPAGTVLVQDVRIETRRAIPLEAFERAVAQGAAPWIT